MDREPGHLPCNPRDPVDSLTWMKVVGVGHNAVGKTCLIKHFCESKFSPGYQPTVGVDYGFKIQDIQGDDVRVNLWDLAGGAEYLDVRNELYAGADAIFLVYDVTNGATFEALDSWRHELLKYGSSHSPVCLVANKVDQHSKRVISASQGKKLALSNKWSYHETSCATGDGVEKMFVDLLSIAMKNRTTTREA